MLKCLELRMFNTDVYVVDSKKDFWKVVHTWFGKDAEFGSSVQFLHGHSDAETHTFYPTRDGCNRLFIVSMEHKKRTLPVDMVLVHEATHVWQGICEAIGEDKPGHEIEAYMIQHISQFLLRSFWGEDHAVAKRRRVRKEAQQKAEGKSSAGSRRRSNPNAAANRRRG